VYKKWRVMAIVILWIVFGVANLLRAGITVYIAPALTEYPPAVPLPLLAGLYGLWGLIFLAAALLVWRRQRPRGAFILALLYQAVLWLLNLVAYRSTYARSLWPRDLLLTLIFLGLVALLAGAKKHQPG
jgi:hypothetical protein